MLTSIYSTVISNIENVLDKVEVFFLIQSQIIILIFQSATFRLVAVIPNYQTNESIQARYSHPADDHPAGITKTDKDFEKDLIFKT